MKTTTYQPGKNIDDIRKKYNIKRVIKLASNENPSGPSIKAITAGIKIQKKILKILMIISLYQYRHHQDLI